MFVFWNPCARAELHQRKRALKLCSATLIRSSRYFERRSNSLGFTLMFSVVYYQLFGTQLIRIPRYFELIVLSLHLKSTPLFRNGQKQSTRRNFQATNKEWGPSINQDSLTLQFFLLLREPRLDGKQAKKYVKYLKNPENSKIFQCNSVCWFIRHIITVFLFNQCLSLYCTVFYYEFYASRLFRNPAISNFFFHFPWEFEIAGQLYTSQEFLL